ncbi:MAG TPA: hypothetical protein VEJ63_21405 [Planctomycetota bacterium]|nr:hypothetical protein [Planctomycetota bacterium]
MKTPARKEDYLTVSRRKFLLLGLSSAAVLASMRSTNSRAEDEALAELAATESDIEGPFYREGAPFTSKLRNVEMKGPPLFVSGTVRATPGGAALKDAIVDVWHADASGRYDNEGDHDSDKFHLRARIKTDEKGAYSFETILPAAYKISEKQSRPRHIHYKVSAKGYRELTTQLYFKGDPHLATDRWAKKSNAMELVKHDSKEDLAARKLDVAYYTCVFDIVLKRK